jgi:glycosyltransferase involved in cell wall biosynthesis
MNTIFISIIIPTHNRAFIIEKCLNSIFNQTYKYFELLVIDDHSEDNSIELLNGINDPRLKILSLTDKYGAQAARNEGIKNASGDWICFNDSDDFWVENKLEIQIKYLENYKFNKNIVFYTDCYREDNNIKTVWDLADIKFSSSYKSLLTNPGPMFQGFLLYKDFLINSGLLDENTLSFQEWDTSLILAKNGARFYHIKEPLFIYNLHSESTISKDLVRDFNGYYNIIFKYKDDIKKVAGINAWKNHLIYLFNKLVNNKIIYNDLNPTTINNIDYLFQEIKYYLFSNKKNINFIKRIIKKLKNIIKRILLK